MTKHEFLEELLYELREYPNEESYGFLDYYTELIDDRMEEGMSEHEAVASLGSVQVVASQIKAELAQGQTATNSQSNYDYDKPRKKIPGWAIVLLILGSPLWLSIGIAGFSVFLSALIVIWSISFAFMAVEFAFGVAAVACIPAAIVMLTKGSILSAGIYCGGVFLMAGLAILGYLAFSGLVKVSVAASKGLFNLVKKIFHR